MAKKVELGRYLASQRVLNNLKIREVSEALDISAIYISEIESGRKIPLRGDKLKKLSDYYSLDYSYVYRLAEETKIRKDFEKIQMDNPDRLAVARSIIDGKIPDDIFKALLDYTKKED